MKVSISSPAEKDDSLNAYQLQEGVLYKISSNGKTVIRLGAAFFLVVSPDDSFNEPTLHSLAEFNNIKFVRCPPGFTVSLTQEEK